MCRTDKNNSSKLSELDQVHLALCMSEPVLIESQEIKETQEFRSILKMLKGAKKTKGAKGAKGTLKIFEKW